RPRLRPVPPGLHASPAARPDYLAPQAFRQSCSCPPDNAAPLLYSCLAASKPELDGSARPDRSAGFSRFPRIGPQPLLSCPTPATDRPGHSAPVPSPIPLRAGTPSPLLRACPLWLVSRQSWSG